MIDDVGFPFINCKFVNSLLKKYKKDETVSFSEFI